MKPKICPGCNKEFIPNTRKQKYCSRKCNYKFKMGWGYRGGRVYEMQKVSNYVKEMV